MIVIRSPFRLSFVGGGSDIESFYKNYPGSVISTSINKYIFINLHKKFEKGFRIAYSKLENVENVADIKHPIVRNSLRLLNIRTPLEIASIADIPGQGTGLGSSSSYTVGLILGLLTLINKKVSKKSLADLACEVEIKLCGEPIGKQDQFAAALGGYNQISFETNGNVNYKKLEIDNEFKSYFESQWVIFFTGISRSASKILAKQSKLIAKKSIFDVQKQLVFLCDDFRSALLAQNLEDLGSILDESWRLKKSISSQVSNSLIDEMYRCAINHGALGGKLLGAGAGGFLFLLVPKNKQKKVQTALRKYRQFYFSSECGGAKVVYRD